jgi:hypothetical protein
MHTATREELLERINALAEDGLGDLANAYPEGFNLGVISIVWEIFTEAPISTYLKRAAAGYTPDDDTIGFFGYWCSDHRKWVQEAAFGNVYEMSRSTVAGGDSDDDDEEDDAE